MTKTKTRKWNGGISEKEKLLNLGEVPIISPKPLKLDKNPYWKEHSAYFVKRMDAAIYKKYEGLCPRCGGSLYNGERMELHHIIERKNNGKYSMSNVWPLHQVCHQQITLEVKP